MTLHPKIYEPRFYGALGPRCGAQCSDHGEFCGLLDYDAAVFYVEDWERYMRRFYFGHRRKGHHATH